MRALPNTLSRNAVFVNGAKKKKMTPKASLCFGLIAFYLVFLSSNVFDASAKRRNIFGTGGPAQQGQEPRTANKVHMYFKKITNSDEIPTHLQPTASTSTENEPASGSTKNEPALTLTKNEPASGSTKNEPALTSTKSEPTLTSTENEPASSRNNFKGKNVETQGDAEAKNINQNNPAQSTGNGQGILEQLSTFSKAFQAEFTYDFPAPLGALFTLSTLYNLATEKSNFHNVLEEAYHFTKEVFKPESIKEASSALRQKGFTRKSLYYRDESLGEAPQALKDVLSTSGIDLLSDAEAFNRLLKNQNANITEIGRTKGDKAQALANAISFDLNWDNSQVERITSNNYYFKPYGVGYSQLPFLSLAGEFRIFISKEYKAAEVPLKASGSGLSLYLIDSGKEKFDLATLSTIRKKVSASEKKSIELEFPSFQWTKTHSGAPSYFRIILKEQNTDLPAIGPIMNPQLRNHLSLCVNEKVISGKLLNTFATGESVVGKEVQGENVELSKLSEPRDNFGFHKPFYFVIFDEPSGQPLFINHVLDPVSAGNCEDLTGTV